MLSTLVSGSAAQPITSRALPLFASLFASARMSFPRLPSGWTPPAGAQRTRAGSFALPDSRLARDDIVLSALAVVLHRHLIAQDDDAQVAFTVVNDGRRSTRVGAISSSTALSEIGDVFGSERGDEDAMQTIVLMLDERISDDLADAPVLIHAARGSLAVEHHAIVPQREMGWFLSHLQRAVEAIAGMRDRSASVMSIALIAPAEADEAATLACRQSDAAATAYEGCELLHDFVLPRSSSVAIALSWRDGSDDALDISYADLVRLGRIVAAELVRLAPGQRVVPLCLAKSVEMIPSMLGVLLAGKAYCAIEPALPVDRKRAIADEVLELGRAADEPSVILCRQGSTGDFPSQSYHPVDPASILAEELAALRRGSAVPDVELPSVEVSPSSLAYVVHTSGSTGKPKGIKIAHSNVAAFLRAYRGVFGRHDRGDCRVLQFPSYAFDVVVRRSVFWAD